MMQFARINHRIALFAILFLFAGLMIVVSGRVSAERNNTSNNNIEFVPASPHERFCVVRSKEFTYTDAERLHAGCVIEHRPQGQVWDYPEEWLPIYVLDTKPIKYGVNGTDMTLDERIEFLKARVSEMVPVYESGSWYSIANEMDRPQTGEGVSLQDDDLPEDYAKVYHELYTHIKTLDPSAVVMIGGIVQPTPLRIAYLDEVLAKYQEFYGTALPTDVWNIHNMILREGPPGVWGAGLPPGSEEGFGATYGLQDNDRMEYFRLHIEDFRQWMADNGYRDHALIVTEYGILMPNEFGYDDDRVIQFMHNTFDYMLEARSEQTGYPADDNRLVQMWAWYSLNDQPWDPDTGDGFNGQLYDHETQQITAMGEAFADYLAHDFSIASLEIAVMDGESNGSVEIHVEVTNSGLYSGKDIAVRLIDENGAGIGSDVILPRVLDGTNETVIFVVDDLSGFYQWSVMVDASNRAAWEMDETNNSVPVDFGVNVERSLLPLVTR